jgi:hypothetical protein
MGAVCSSETSMSASNTARCQNTESCCQNSPRHKNLKNCIFLLLDYTGQQYRILPCELFWVTVKDTHMQLTCCLNRKQITPECHYVVRWAVCFKSWWFVSQRYEPQLNSLNFQTISPMSRGNLDRTRLPRILHFVQSVLTRLHAVHSCSRHDVVAARLTSELLGWIILLSKIVSSLGLRS